MKAKTRKNLIANAKNCFTVRKSFLGQDVSFLFLRVFLGYAFVMHGLPKMQNPLAWMGASSPVPGLFQFLGAFAEFGGGIALILGLLTSLASLGLVITMIGAATMHLVIMGDPIISKGGSSAELALTFLFISLVFMICGPGKISLDYKIFGARK